MRNFHLNRNHSFCPTINLDKLWALVGQENFERAKKEGDKVPVIDIVQFVSDFISFSNLLSKQFFYRDTISSWVTDIFPNNRLL